MAEPAEVLDPNNEVVDPVEVLAPNDEVVDVVEEPKSEDDGETGGKKRKESVVDEEESKSEDDGEPDRKKRKYCLLDVKIIVKGTDETGTKPVEKVFYKNAHQLAQFSDFFDAALSSNMQEQNTRVVTLNDAMPPELFETALEYLECAKKARAATPQDMLKVVAVYDKYQFSGGLELCDAVLLEHLQEEAKKPFPDDIDFLVEAIADAAHFSLKASKKAGVEYLEGRFVSQDTAIGSLMFSPEHLAKLQPLFLQGCFTEAALPSAMRNDPAIFENPRFADLFLLHHLNQASAGFERGPLSLLTSQGHDFGQFYHTICGNKRGYMNLSKPTGLPQLFIYKGGETGKDDWEVATADGQRLLWRSPGSRKLWLPPERGWQIVDGRYGYVHLTCRGYLPVVPVLRGNPVPVLRGNPVVRGNTATRTNA